MGSAAVGASNRLVVRAPGFHRPRWNTKLVNGLDSHQRKTSRSLALGSNPIELRLSMKEVLLVTKGLAITAPQEQCPANRERIPLYP